MTECEKILKEMKSIDEDTMDSLIDNADTQTLHHICFKLSKKMAKSKNKDLKNLSRVFSKLTDKLATVAYGKIKYKTMGNGSQNF